MGCILSKTQRDCLEDDNAGVAKKEAYILRLPDETILRVCELMAATKPHITRSGSHQPVEVTSWLQRDRASTQQLLNLALACRSLTGPALEVLWSSVQLIELLKISYTTDRSLTMDRSSDGQWERFYMYARYVRALSVGRMQHERTLSLESISKIAEHTKDRNLFPVLTELIWHLGAQPEPVKILAPMLLCPSLRKLSLDVHMETPQFAIEPMLDGILSIVQKRCSHLFALRVHYEYRVRQFSKILFERCAQLPELTYIDCDSKLDSPPADNAQWISDIICHPNLTYVRVWIQAVEICLSSTQGGLRDNVHLHLYFRGDANMALALQSIPVLPITGFSVKMEHSQNPCAVYISELSASFASRFGTSLQAVHLDICLPTFEYKDLLRVVYYVTRPWCVFPELRDFVCLLEPGLSGLILQQLEDVTVMAAAWPLLEHLKLYFGPQYALPFRSLLSLARSCPLLKSVDMPLKGRIEQNTWPKDGSMKHGLERLYHQGRAKPSVDDATVVALRDAFPSAVIADHPSN